MAAMAGLGGMQAPKPDMSGSIAMLRQQRENLVAQKKRVVDQLENSIRMLDEQIARLSDPTKMPMG